MEETDAVDDSKKGPGGIAHGLFLRLLGNREKKRNI